MCLAAGMGAGPAAGARPVKPLSAWEQAVRDRTMFDRAESHTRAEFTRILDEFRAVYHGSPREVHAPAAVDAVAALLAEQGLELNDPGSLKAAAGQYEFLRAQYPGSPLSVAAKAKIARLKSGETVADSRVVGTGSRVEGSGMRDESAETLSARPGKIEVPAHRESAAMNGARESSGVMEEGKPSAGEPVTAPPVAVKAVRTGRSALVTGIRHWSTATYTRVAIDLGDEVTFEAARVPKPDRIYFDLHGAKLAQELVGKSFDVTDDGFLKKIRAAQFSGDMTRVVLDVSDVSEYSAFLLPNPYRLIVDIHGGSGRKGQPQELAKDVRGSALLRDSREEGSGTGDDKTESRVADTTPVEPAAVVRASAAANSSGLPAMAPTSLPVENVAVARASAPGSGAAAKENGRALPETPRSTPTDQERPSGTTAFPVKPERMGHLEVAVAKSVPAPRTGTVAKATAARPVPNTVSVKAPESSTEVAALSAAPGKVDASREASTRPISATVSGGRDGVKDVYLGSASRRGRSGSGAGSGAANSAELSAPAKAADKTADGQTSLVRALGLKIGRIVIDAGHGGHDSGTLGADGIEEKDVVLDVALRLGKLLHERLGAEIIYTRSDDTFIPLETRTAIANKAQADLFISVHANSSADETARGVETYYLNFTSDPTALDVAARENAVSGSSIHQLSDLVKKITLKDKISESREFASDVESSLYAGLRRGNDGLKDRGVKKAPFVVLIGANMPSILAEISFVTNPKDAEQLRRPEYRERVAESLFNGVAKYESGLSGAKPAPVVRAAAQ